MNVEEKLRTDCDSIVRTAIGRVLPGEAVRRALEGRSFPGGRLLLAAVGKAGWSMAEAAMELLGERVDEGIVITRHGYSRGPLGRLRIREAGHPVPDGDTLRATEEALTMTEGLSAEDTVLFLLSGGGSALFEAPKIPFEELQQLTELLLGSGAEIGEINTVRKRLSRVKGGRFALHCAPARVFSVILSDVLGDRAEVIASGPTCPDPDTVEDARRICGKYALPLSAAAQACMEEETPKRLDNAEALITGSVRELCRAAAEQCRALGYETVILTDCLSCEAREAGSFLASVAAAHADTDVPLAFIAGGETVVHLRGSGKGGRNQELALAAAGGIGGLENAAVFSFGSDGADGPTDAAGGFVSGATAGKLREKGVELFAALENNDSYTALGAADGLIVTGPTLTNVNDCAVVLIRPKKETNRIS